MTEQSGKQRCGAKTRENRPCQRWAMDNGRCRLHGGRDIDDKRLLPDSTRNVPGRPPTHGRYSKYLPDQLGDKIKEFQEDEQFLNLQDEIALIRSLTAKWLEKSDKLTDMTPVLALVEQTKKLAQAYMAIEKDRKFALSHEEVLRIMKAIVVVLDNNIKDEALLAKIQGELNEIKV